MDTETEKKMVELMASILLTLQSIDRRIADRLQRIDDAYDRARETWTNPPGITPR